MEDLRNKIISEANGSLRRRGSGNFVTSVTNKTICEVMDRIGLSLTKGQRTTKATQFNQSDIRNFVSCAALHGAYAKDKDPNLIGNWDFSTFGINFDGKDFSEKSGKYEDLPPPTRTTDGGLSIFIKICHLHVASGLVAPRKRLANDQLEPSNNQNPNSDNEVNDNFNSGNESSQLNPNKSDIFEKVKGLSTHLHASYGYLSICPSRTRQKSTFRKFLTEIFFPFVEECRSQIEFDENVDPRD
jgi:hypothetical protein